MVSTEGLVPITRAFLASYYDKYPFTPLSDDVSRLSQQIYAMATTDLLKDSPPAQGESSLIREAEREPPHKVDENMWKNREQIEEILFLLEAPHWPRALQQRSTVEDEELASVLSIHMDEQVDGKTLLGTYVCTEQPGEFRWQPGSLTQAVLNGFWVVFEDIDKAPTDIISILLPLLEGAITFSTGHGEAVRVNQSFRLFSTVTSSNSDTSRFTEGRNSLGAVWRKIMIAPPSKQDLLNITLQWYPELEHLAPKLIETFERVNQFTKSQLGLLSSSSSNDRFTLRDLLKFCKRVASLVSYSGHERLTSYACDNIYKEAIDVFASFSTSATNRLVIMREIARLSGVVGTETLYAVSKPVIQELKSEFRIGRCNLQHAEMASNRDRKPFVELRASAHALEKIACSVKFNEPVLLVGETSTGKTTLVQTLSTRLGQKLTVLNLSQQSDVADLLGGFKPIDAGFACIPLYQEFENLFTNTFSSKDNGVYLTRLRKFLTEKNWKMMLRGFQNASTN